jgi:hypothetical protein
MPSDPRIRRAIDDVSHALAKRRPPAEALLLLTTGAVSAIPRVDYASISILRGGDNLETLSATDPLIDKADAIQMEFQQGPSYETVTDNDMVVSEDVRADRRWPEYGPRAADLGLLAQMAVLLTLKPNRSALNLYARRRDVFGPDAIETAELFASHAAVVVGVANVIQSLSHAVDSRAVIGQAMGIVMERFQIDKERAFQFLVRVSSQSNVKLREVAEDIVCGLDGRTHLEGDPSTGQPLRKTQELASP